MPYIWAYLLLFISLVSGYLIAPPTTLDPNPTASQKIVPYCVLSNDFNRLSVLHYTPKAI